MRPIVTALETATRAAGLALVARTQDQIRREGYVLHTEHMLGWEHDDSAGPLDRATAVRARLALMLLGEGGHERLLLGASFAGVGTILIGLLFDISHVLLALLVIGMAALVWYRLRAA
jgi:hypothetical protein